MSNGEHEPLKALYAGLAQRHAALRKRLGRPLTLAEKILGAHAADAETQAFARGTSYLTLKPDRVIMQDATAQMAILQFMLAGRDAVAVPTTVHCDHLIQARVGASGDMQAALDANREVYDFLRSASQRYGMGFWQPGAGIIHQVFLEQYAFPGGLIIGTDSHTPNAGGLGMLAIGVGGSEAADVMAGLPWEVKCPKLIGVRLTGRLSGWTSPKDVILKVCGLLTTKGGTNKILEYFGAGTRSISCTGKATITNMGAELGATTSVFPFDERMSTYLRATGRAGVADLAQRHAEDLGADPQVQEDPRRFYDEVIEIDLSWLEPHIVGPRSPDVARPISQLAKDVERGGWPPQINVALIGSCTNSSYEDIGRAASVARQARQAGLKAKCYFLITPGSDQIYETIRRDGQLEALEAIGGTVLANACGPCIGQWRRDDIAPGEVNSILTSFNRNFPRRNDGTAETLAFMGSPELVTAMALAADLRFNPLTDSVDTPDGRRVKLSPPEAPELPSNGFARGMAGCLPPLPQAERRTISVLVPPGSERLHVLEPFRPWNGRDFERLPVLIKVRGQCTTDHISPAGKWLRFRGHLDRISDNMFTAAENVFTKHTGMAIDQLDGNEKPIPEAARHYKAEGLGWVAVGDENYGEGSSREHAAMSPRHLKCKAVIAKSFARLHETNLKKQGILPLTLTAPSDYDAIDANVRVSLTGLKALAPGEPVTAILHRADGSTMTIQLNHSLTDEQIRWFRAGSALNLIRTQQRRE
ncbi:MAG TPA: aconitate hydratase [Candidatus Omnitrophica bacterium]|nr:MAG: aconitate hydratase [Omnitrophica WOR_2 bacterium GWA2_63_20]OGX17132.1 MAG: aconitate hydratase [Omnitrophica WOR_2 bacterium GWF2_63_9]OGX30669.1 MAG: aconitate hydratase [Omnitrophica WOR_2 bacterium RIFCSPHIGHO2_12_FULL_64_13]OGX34743.1 MAG: aconitate hydratase [Omnitrophica WOR_2 bacterium RIFCSPHIGHO2_02_FULL_63_39]OGX44284.1 MAG: aconitate hydratase [Omnitrophica WOR_2 bacterium RIFCSPLOWO2_02_FULL_63_16]OGX47446.1 MAG: aconitate hydratase [Omnitrophica WOR_2 bacterium RIFCSPLOW